MLKYGYQPKIGLGPKANSIVDPIQLKHQRGTIGLGYESTSGGVYNKGSGVMIFTLAQVLVLKKVVDKDIIDGLGNLFVVMIKGGPEVDFKKLTIRDSKLGEVLQNWTISPSLFRQESW
ncbi:hypothetical protein P3S67_027400 [Capsicum chacoense]